MSRSKTKTKEKEVQEVNLPETREVTAELAVPGAEESPEEASADQAAEEAVGEVAEEAAEAAVEEAQLPETAQENLPAVDAAAEEKPGTGVRRLVFVGISVLLELLGIIFLVTNLSAGAEWVSVLIRLLAVLLVLGIYSQNKTSALKTPWIVLIMAFPVLGVTLYLMTGVSGSTKKMSLRFAQVDTLLFPKMPQNTDVLEKLESRDMDEANLARYLKHYAGYPVYQNTDVRYFPDASLALEAQKEAMRGAKKFIFMEYHAIEDAQIWQEILEILEEKAKEGVEVRIFYDDMGSVGFVNTDFVKRMEEKGLRCRVFNPLSPVLNLFLNNRDHRKITVVDGVVGFTGGYNIADEYFNVTQPYGQWKDTGIELRGDAVRSLTVTFLEMWNAVRDNDVDDHYCDQYLPDLGYEAQEPGERFVQPYGDSPMDEEATGENVYISLIEDARKYIWFVTPYLILTDEMMHALGLAAKRGVDVRIITPGVPDKKLVYEMTRSYYFNLVRSGVRIYEYTPGFCHCKMCVTDDRVATCGTINLDYRSLYHHFENGCVLYGGQAVADIRKDFEDMFAVSEEVTDKYGSNRAARLRIKDLALRFFAPLL